MFSIWKISQNVYKESEMAQLLKRNIETVLGITDINDIARWII